MQSPKVAFLFEELLALDMLNLGAELLILRKSDYLMSHFFGSFAMSIILGGIFPLGAYLLNTRSEKKRNGFIGASILIGLSTLGQMTSLNGHAATMTFFGSLFATLAFVILALKFPPEK